jgi:hypothetical protein
LLLAPFAETKILSESCSDTTIPTGADPLPLL